MKDRYKTKDQLISELKELRRRVSILETAYNREHGPAEQDLRSERDMLQSLMDGLSRTEIGVDVVDVNYRILYQNRLLAGRFGDCTGKLCYEEYMERRTPCDLCPMKMAIRSGKMESMELRASDGRTYELFSAPLPDPHGTVDKVIEVVRDVTERRQTESRLRLLSSAIEQSSEGIAITNIEGNLLFANNAFAEMHGYTAGELAGMHLSVFHTPEQMLSMEEANRQTKETGSFSGEIWHARRDGTAFPTLMHNSLMRDEAGSTVAMIGAVRDITEMKKTEVALRESEERYRAVFQNTGTATCILEEDTTISLANERFEELSGCSREEIEGKKSWIEFVTQEYLEKMKEYHKERRTGEGKAPTSYDFDFKSAKGNIKKIHLTIAVIPGTKKSVASLHDITERKHIEEALRESEDKYRSIFETAPISIVMVDREGLIVDINPHHVTSIGRGITTKGDYIGKNIVTHPSIAAAGLSGDYDRILKGEPFDRTDVYFPTLSGGADGYFNVSGRPLLKEGEVVGAITIHEDITERKRLEKEQQRHAKLESVGTLAGGIAHDFNNLLSAIIGYIELARMNAVKESDVRSNLDECMKGIAMAKQLTQQLLTFSKGGTPVKGPVKIDKVIKETAEFCLRGSNSNAEYVFAEGLRNADVDREQIAQVIQNLTINAFQAMPRGGVISFSAENEHVTSNPNLEPGDYVKVNVRDQGLGIPKEHLTSIFDPYFSTKQEGSGLGLATSYSIIKKHGGDINVDSTLGEGTTFTIYLPVAISREALEERAGSGYAAGEGQKILVLEDEDIVARSIGKVLERLGYNPEVVGDGQEAVDLYKRAKEKGDPFDLVITDLTIRGGMGGKEANRLILEYDPEARTVVSSGYATDPILANFEDYGYRAALPKPVKFDILGTTMADVLKTKKNK